MAPEPQPPAPAVVAVVVTCDPGPWFEQALGSLAGQDYPNLSVLVVDAASEADPTERVAELAPGAFVMRLDRRVGFGRAANEVLKLVDGASHFLFCHDDVVLAPDAVRLLLEEAFRSNAGIASPKYVQWEHPDRLLAVGATADKVGVVQDLVEPGELDQEQHDAVREVLVAPGGATLVRADLFRALGGFNATIDQFGEDLDLSWRARVAGARIVVVPAARVRHLQAVRRGVRRDWGSPASRRRAARLTDEHRIRTLLTCYRWFNLVWIVPLALVYLLGEAVTRLLQGRPGDAWQTTASFGRAFRSPGRLWRSRRRVQRRRQASDASIRRLQTRGNARLRAFLRARVEDVREGLPPAPVATLAGAGRAGKGRAGRRTSPGSRSLRRPGSLGRTGAWRGCVHSLAHVGPRRRRTDCRRGVRLAEPARPRIAGDRPAAEHFGRVVGDLALVVVDLAAVRAGRHRAEQSGSGAARPAGDRAVRGGRHAAARGRTGSPGHRAARRLPGRPVVGLPAGPPGRRCRLRRRAAVRTTPWPAATGRVWWPTPPRPGCSAPWAGSPARSPSRSPGPARSGGRIIGLGLLVAVTASVAPSFLVRGPPHGAGAGRRLGSGRAGSARAGRCWWRRWDPAWWRSCCCCPGRPPSSAAGRRRSASAPGPRAGWASARCCASTPGPFGHGALGWALLVVAALPLIIGRGWRLAWAARLWVVAMVFFWLTWAGSRGWIPALPPEVGLAPAAAALAGSAALGAVAFELDLPGYRFGWRQLAAAVAGVALALAAIPMLIASGQGRWHLPSADASSVLAFLPDSQAGRLPGALGGGAGRPAAGRPGRWIRASAWLRPTTASRVSATCGSLVAREPCLSSPPTSGWWRTG